MSRKPWDAPPRSTTYDKDPEVLFAAIGSALSSWQYVEDAIARIFEVLVSESNVRSIYPASMSPAERAYGSIVSFDGRASMVEAAAEAFFHVNRHSTYPDRLRELIKACRGWSARRNEVAHGRIGGSPVDLNYCALGPAESSARKNAVDHHPAFVYNSAQIKTFDRQFFGGDFDLLGRKRGCSHGLGSLD